jgi:thiamine-monophosphate kinase
LGSNLSDLSAMGAQAEHAWLTLALPIVYSQTQANRLRHALQDCLDRCAIRLAGGDTVAISGPLFMSMTLQGSADPKRILRRSSARPGDAILVSGALGSAHAGLYAWRQRDRLWRWPGWERLRKRFWAPPDRTVLGRALGRHAARYACMDLSDGLAKDLRRLCAASGVGARIFAELLPMDPDLEPAAAIAKADPRDWALSGGEDYELLFTCPPEQAAHWVDQYACTWIGEILAGARVVVDWGKGVERLLRGGWEHGRGQK